MPNRGFRCWLAFLLVWERDRKKMNLKEIRRRAIRTLMLRAGGRYRVFEAGMLYQMLLDLGMKKEFTTHKQVDDLIEVTCRFFHEVEAKEMLDSLLKGEPIPKHLLSNNSGEMEK